MVLVRSENGQLLMIPQHTLAQMQAHAQSQPQTTMTPRPATPTSASSVQISTVQVSSLRNVSKIKPSIFLNLKVCALAADGFEPFKSHFLFILGVLAKYIPVSC